MTPTKFNCAAIAALSIVVAGTAHAGTPGWYIGGEAGASFLDDADNSIEINPEPGTQTMEPGGLLGDLFGGLGDAGLEPVTGPLSDLLLGPNQTVQVPAEGIQADFETEYDTGFAAGLTLGYEFELGFRTEAELRYNENDFDRVTLEGDSSRNARGDIAATALMLNGWYDFNSTGRFSPYIGGGIGVAEVEVNDFAIFDGSGGISADDTVFAYQGGLGVAFDVTDRVTLDLGYRYFATDDPQFRDSSTTIDFEYQQHLALFSVRFVFAPSGRTDSDGDGVPDALDNCPNTPAGAPVDAKGCPLDSDGDGVPDYLDKCPNTNSGTPVGEDGCPLDADGDGVPDHLDKCPNTPEGAPVDKKGCALDSDGDGVPDYLDNCPNTPAGAVVNEKGCPTVVDSDGDGVPDNLDQCPDTPAGVPVTSTGCAANQSTILEGVKYEFNSANLTINAKRILDEVAQTLKDSPGFSIELSGHTDSIGNDSYNQQLSQQRADSARRYLISQGISPSRIDAVGYGESRPIAPNMDPDGTDNPEGRAKNRRTEIKVLR